MATVKTVTVKALVQVLDDGVRHEPGEIFEMEESLVAPHVAAGQIEVAAAEAATKKKQPV